MMMSCQRPTALSSRCPAPRPGGGGSGFLFARTKTASAPRTRIYAAKKKHPAYSGADIPPPAKGGRHFLHLDDFTADELHDMLDRSAKMKQQIKEKRNVCPYS